MTTNTSISMEERLAHLEGRLDEIVKHMATKADLWKTAFALLLAQSGLILTIIKFFGE